MNQNEIVTITIEIDITLDDDGWYVATATSAEGEHMGHGPTAYEAVEGLIGQMEDLINGEAE